MLNMFLVRLAMLLHIAEQPLAARVAEEIDWMAGKQGAIGAELRGGAFSTGQANGARPAAPATVEVGWNCRLRPRSRGLSSETALRAYCDAHR